MTNRRIPDKGENNLWYCCNESDTVIVFVHGIFSDSRSCWMYEDKYNSANNKYWPEMIIEDNRINEVSIYLAGFYTAIDAGPYEIRNCADEILAAIQRVDANFNPTVLSKKNIIFVCHSTGGIVIRYLLENNHTLFVEKNIGLVLIASPSYGSKLENKLDWLSKFYNQKLGQQLKWGNWSLSDLDDRFKKLLYEKRILNFYGVEGYENRFIIFKCKWLPFLNDSYVVTKESAGRYFGPPILLKDTDHFSAAKPNDMRHPTHEQLFIGFLSKYFPILLKNSTPQQKSDSDYEKKQPQVEKKYSHDSKRDAKIQMNEINICRDVNGSKIVEGTSNTLNDNKVSVTINLSNDRMIAKNQITPQDIYEKKQIDVDDNTQVNEIEFVNRISELQFMTNSIYGPPYILIDSPKGYGKTRLMKAVSAELERQNWLCISIDLREKVFSSIGEMANHLLTILNKDDTFHCDLTHPENAGGEVGRCILQKLNQVNKKAVLIQMDTLEKLDRDLINDLLIIN